MASRYDGARRRGIVDQEFRGLSEAQKRHMDAMAYEAELRVCAFFGVRLLGGTAGRPDHGYDLVIPSTGETCDVKWTATEPGVRYGRTGVGYPTLNLSTWKAQRASVYVLVCGATIEAMDRLAWTSGYARIGELLAAPLVEGRYGRPYHALGFDYLHPLEELL